MRRPHRRSGSLRRGVRLPAGVGLYYDFLLSAQGGRFTAADAQYALDWIEAAPPGADLSSVPGQLVLELLRAPELSAELASDPALASLHETIVQLHTADLAGDPKADDDWAGARLAAKALAKASGDRFALAVVKVLGAAALSLRREPSVLNTVASAVLAFASAVLALQTQLGLRASDWTDEDDRRFEATLAELRQAQQPAQEAGRRIDWQALMAERAPQLAEGRDRHHELRGQLYVSYVQPLRQAVIGRLRASGE